MIMRVGHLNFLIQTTLKSTESEDFSYNNRHHIIGVGYRGSISAAAAYYPTVAALGVVFLP